MGKKTPKQSNPSPKDDASEVVPPVVVSEIEKVLGVVTPVVPAHGRTMGVKEIIPFSWKVIGRSGDAILTLFKSIERKDSEAQHERLIAEGYYRQTSQPDSGVDRSLLARRELRSRGA